MPPNYDTMRFIREQLNLLMADSVRDNYKLAGARVTALKTCFIALHLHKYITDERYHNVVKILEDIQYALGHYTIHRARLAKLVELLEALTDQYSEIYDSIPFDDRIEMMFQEIQSDYVQLCNTGSGNQKIT